MVCICSRHHVLQLIDKINANHLYLYHVSLRRVAPALAQICFIFVDVNSCIGNLDRNDLLLVTSLRGYPSICLGSNQASMFVISFSSNEYMSSESFFVSESTKARN